MSTISTSGIAPSSVIRAEHVLRIINALSSNANNDIIISGSLTVTGSTALSGSLNVTGGVTGSFSGDGSNLTGVTATANTSSLLTTASISGNTLTFTKGNSSTFNITIPSGGSISTGSFATTGSNQFSGSQGITGSIDLDNGSFTTLNDSSIMTVSPNLIIIENQGSPFNNTLLGQGVLSHYIGNNVQQLLFPASLSTGIKAITLPNDTGTVALTYNTVTTSSFNSFTSSYNTGSFTGSFVGDGSGLTGIPGVTPINTGSFATTGSNTFNGNQTISGSLKQGHLVTSSGNFSHAEGYKSQAVGQYSHAEGGGPAGTFTEQIGGRATGTGSHAEGSFTLASGSFSHAEGQFTTASAPWSHAEGLGTITNGWYQHAQGQYNIASSTSAAFIVGNGTSEEDRSNLVFAAGTQVQVTGSVRITTVLTLTPNNPLPPGQPTGSIAVSGSGADCKPYFWNGATWTSMI